MTAIKFLKPFACYQREQVATFPADTAARLIASGVAAAYAPEPVVRGKARTLAAKIVRKG